MRDTNQNFRLNKTAKRLLASAPGNAHDRGDLRRLLIKAQVAGDFVPKSRKERDTEKTDA